MTNSLTFRILFHGPFRISTGKPSGGYDNTVGDDPLPASSLKGVMRASADHLAVATSSESIAATINAVFGAKGEPGAWAWTSASFGTAPVRVGRSRIAIDPATHTVEKGALMRGQHFEAEDATFEVTQSEWLTDEVRDRHHQLLCAAAMGTHSLGGHRNRGLGWVRIEPTELAFTADVLAAWLLNPQEKVA